MPAATVRSLEPTVMMIVPLWLARSLYSLAYTTRKEVNMSIATWMSGWMVLVCHLHERMTSKRSDRVERRGPGVVCHCVRRQWFGRSASRRADGRRSLREYVDFGGHKEAVLGGLRRSQVLARTCLLCGHVGKCSAIDGHRKAGVAWLARFFGRGAVYVSDRPMDE